MRVAVSGKGGSGKTTLAGTLARHYARSGRAVLAIDGDPNPNLAVTLGISRESPMQFEPLPRNLMVEVTDDAGAKQRVLDRPVDAIVAEYGVSAPDDVRLLLGSRVDHSGKG